MALKTLHITGVACFTLLFPYVSIGACTIIFISSLSILLNNKKEIAKQREHPSGFDEATTRKALEAVQESIALYDFSQLTNAICITALAISCAVSPILLVVSTFFLTLNWVVSTSESKIFKQLKQTFDEQALASCELHKLERIYPEIFNRSPQLLLERVRILKEEKSLRDQAKRYNLRIKGCIADAWEHLLKVEKFTVEQGLEGDWNIFQPLCRLAVIKELELGSLKLDSESIAPSLRKRIPLINEIRDRYMKLTETEKNQVVEKAITQEHSISMELTALMQAINSISFPMMQEQDLFQDSLIHGAESYSLKSLHLMTFLKLQQLKLKNYRKKLFFVAENPIEQPPPQENEEVLQSSDNELQGYLVIDGVRLPIHSIRLA